MDDRKLTLRLMTHPTVKPIPMAFVVFDGATAVGQITLPEFFRAQARLAECGDPLPKYLEE